MLEVRAIHWGAAVMTNSSRLRIIRIVASAVSLLALAAISSAQERPPAAVQMSKAYGLDSFGQVEKIRFTFNLEFPGLKLARTWEFEPKTDQISYEGKDKDGKAVKLTYNRSRLGSESDAVKNEIEPAFTNDEYWLFFPLHVAWDTSAKVTDEGLQKLPQGEGSAKRVVVKYPSDGGYAPGDTWELYVAEDHQVKELVYHAGAPGVQKRPNLLAVTWTGHKKAGPLLISTDHVGTADGKPVRVFLTDVAVKVTGSDGWIDAK
jgi:hypothetical protein